MRQRKTLSICWYSFLLHNYNTWSYRTVEQKKDTISHKTHFLGFLLFRFHTISVILYIWPNSHMTSAHNHEMPQTLCYFIFNAFYWSFRLYLVFFCLFLLFFFFILFLSFSQLFWLSSIFHSFVYFNRFK